MRTHYLLFTGVTARGNKNIIIHIRGARLSTPSPRRYGDLSYETRRIIKIAGINTSLG